MTPPFRRSLAHQGWPWGAALWFLGAVLLGPGVPDAHAQPSPATPMCDLREYTSRPDTTARTAGDELGTARRLDRDGHSRRVSSDGLSLSWRVPINDGYARPAVAGGRVFVFDARPVDPNGMEMIERILCLDEETGGTLWSHEWAADYAGLQPPYTIGPRATPTVDGDRVYVQGAKGQLVALDVGTGDVLWSKITWPTSARWCAPMG